MFESIELRKAKNGFVVVVTTDDGSEEYVYDSSRKAVKFIKEFVEVKPAKTPVQE